jgi:NDP-sugar pyrophosphorylase family protein
MKITKCESEVFNELEVYFNPTDLNGIQHEFWMCVQKEKDSSKVNIYWLNTYKSSEQICSAIEHGKNLQKFFPKDQIEYILSSIKEGLMFVKLGE